MRTILHVDMDAFFASVEQRDHPEYRGRPLIIGASPNERGVVSTCSYEARKYGVHSAMPSREAGALCPHGIFIPGDHSKYSRVSQEIMVILESFTPVVEQVSVDEAYLDVSGSTHIFGDGEEIAKAIREKIRRELDLPASVGVGANKLISKICSEMAKPNGYKVAPADADAIAGFLAPLAARELPGVGKVACEKLSAAGLRSIGDIQRCDKTTLVNLLGISMAEYLSLAAYGIDERPIVTVSEEQSISREHTFNVDTTDRLVVRDKLHELSDDVGCRLRASGKWARKAHLKIRWDNFTTITRQKQIPTPVRDDFSIFAEALTLFNREKLIAPVRLIGFGLSGLSETKEVSGQLELFQDGAFGESENLSRRERLSDTIDLLRSKLGKDAVKHLGLSDNR